MIEGTATMAPYFSLADAARFLNEPPHKKGDVFYEGPLHLGSSLVFYLNRPFFLVNQSADAELAPSGRQNWRDRFLSEPFSSRNGAIRKPFISWSSLIACRTGKICSRIDFTFTTRSRNAGLTWC